MNRKILSLALAAATVLLVGNPAQGEEDFWEVSGAYRDDLLISTYITAGQVRQLAGDEAFRERTVPTLRSMGVRTVYLEVYRGGVELEEEELVAARDFLEGHGFATAAGIATVPGGDFGVRQDRGYTWFNWQDPKTQEDLKRVSRRTARVFDTFIVDDFLCTDDKSPLSEAARGDRSWGVYRRDLLTELSQSLFIEPAREENPDIHMIIKYPQWYDLFHRFGYDPPRMSPLFDEVYVGTETRGPHTPRFGFVPPYLGFNNYRWLADIEGPPAGGAWFDHGDCDADDFVRQAWYSVLAGAPELILFSFAALLDGHPGHEEFRAAFPGLAALAKAVRETPVRTVPAYKPPHGEPGGDMYLLDFLGMEGLPLAPVPAYPGEAEAVLLYQGAAADPDIDGKVLASLEQGVVLIMTANFLAALPEGSPLLGVTGLADGEVTVGPHDAEWETVRVNPGPPPVNRVAAQLTAGDAEAMVVATVDGEAVPLLLRHLPEAYPRSVVLVLNTFTYTQADFDAIEEVLLAPGPRDFSPLAAPLQEAVGYTLRSPSGVSRHPMGDRIFFWNANDTPATITQDGAPDKDTEIPPHAGAFVTAK